MSLISKYKVELDVFHGPLDLLLHLIKKNEVDIYDIPISTITEKYIEYIDLLKSLNLDMAGEFLVMAATLTHIKSKMLLPIPEMEEEEEEGPDPREELMRRLILYKMFKEASIELTGREVLGRDVFRRGMPVTLDDVRDTDSEEELSIDSTLFDLMDAFKDVLKRFPKDYTLDLTVERFRLTDKINHIMEKMALEKSVIFGDLFPSDASKGEVIVTFLAILELAKSLLLKVFQGDEGSIRLYASAGEGSDALSKVDIVNEEEYSGGGEAAGDKDGGEVLTERDPEKALEEELEKEIEEELDSELGAKPGEELDIESLEAKARELMEEEVAKEARAQESEAKLGLEVEKYSGSGESGENSEYNEDNQNGEVYEAKGNEEENKEDSEDVKEPGNEEEETAEIDSGVDSYKEELSEDSDQSIDDGYGSAEDLIKDIDKDIKEDSHSFEETGEEFGDETGREESPEEMVAEEAPEVVVEESVETQEVELPEEKVEEVQEEAPEVVDDEETSSEVDTEIPINSGNESNDNGEETKAETEVQEKAVEERETEVEPNHSVPASKPSVVIHNMVADLEAGKLKGIESLKDGESETVPGGSETVDKVIKTEEPIEKEETVKPKKSIFGRAWSAVTKMIKKFITGRTD